MATGPLPRLEWPHKGQVPLETQGGEWRWLALDDPRLRREMLPVGTVGDHAEPSGALAIGDAYTALSALRADGPSMGVDGGVRLVYIDPPYNTGGTFEHYSDNVDSSVWLSRLACQLEEVRPLLSEDGSVWVHLDDSEVHHARCLLDEVFGPDAFVTTIVWQKRLSRESRTAFSSNHDYIHVYAPAGPRRWKQSRNLLPNDGSSLRNRDNDPRGPWADAPFDAPGYRPNQQYAITNPAGHVIYPPRGRSWYATQPVFEELLADGRIWFTRRGAGKPRMKRFPDDLPGLVPFSLWPSEMAGTNEEAKRHLQELFPHREVFATPKPEALLQHVLHIGSDPGDLVLDFYAGSGTTAAVAHKMGRRWLAVEHSTSTVADFALPRLSKVVAGDDPGGISPTEDWAGGGAFSVFAMAGQAPVDALRGALEQVGGDGAAAMDVA